MERGFSSPLIKEVTPDGSQMWFSQDGIDYVADLSGIGVTNVSKATFPVIPERQRSTITNQPEVLSYEDE